MTNPFSSIRAWGAEHKLASAGIAVAALVGGIGMYRSATSASAATQYVLSPVTTGNIVQTVTGSGQVSAANQIDLAPQASGAITSIPVAVGQHVRAGDLIATIDDTNARNALANAKLSYAQLTESAKPGDIANAQNAVDKSYSDGFGAVSSSFTDLQAVMIGLNGMLYTQTGFLSDQRSTTLPPLGQNYRQTVGQDYDKANNEYIAMLAEYKTVDRQSATSSIARLVSDTYNLVKDVSITMQDAQTLVTWIAANVPSYGSASSLSAAETSVTSWSNSVTSDVSSLSQASNTIVSDANALYNLETGADPLAVQAGGIALDQAQQTYDNYFVRAPFDGVIGRIPAALYSQASGSTVIATLVGAQKIATISLDEVDAARVKVGQPVSITFDAISNFTATGTVSVVDWVGTVSGGVVSYGVKIAVNTVDERILPGMSLNTTITVNELDGVTIIPSAAVKTSGNQKYVQTLDQTAVRAYMQAQTAASGRTASSTRAFGTATSTGTFGSGTASSTRSFTGSFAGRAGAGRTAFSVTMPSATPPVNTVVATGQSDSTNIQVISGLTSGQWVVTRTIAAGSATATAAPSLLSSLTGGARGGGTGGGAATVRTGGGAAPSAAATGR